jgi:hypothetical protein
MTIEEKRKQEDFLTKEYLEELLKNPYLNPKIKDKITKALNSDTKLYQVSGHNDFVLYNAENYIHYLNKQQDNILASFSMMLVLSLMMSTLIFADETFIKVFGYIFLSFILILCSMFIFSTKDHKKSVKIVENDNKEYLRLIRQANVRM